MNKHLVYFLIASASINAHAETPAQSRFAIVAVTPFDDLETNSRPHNFVDVSALKRDPEFMAQQAAALHRLQDHRRHIAHEDNTQAQRRRNNSMLQVHINEYYGLEKVIQILEEELTYLRNQQLVASPGQYRELSRDIEFKLKDLSQARSRRDELVNVIIPREIAADDRELAARKMELRNMR